MARDRYGMSYHGLMALQTGFLVGFTQLIPEHQVQLFGLIKMRVKKLPMLYVGFSNVMCLVGFQSPFLLIQMGWLVSWAYLRFVKWSEGGEFRGDRSETFAFASWFPPFIQCAPLAFQQWRCADADGAQGAGEEDQRHCVRDRGPVRCHPTVVGRH